MGEKLALGLGGNLNSATASGERKNLRLLYAAARCCVRIKQGACILTGRAEATRPFTPCKPAVRCGPNLHERPKVPDGMRSAMRLRLACKLRNTCERSVICACACCAQQSLCKWSGSTFKTQCT